MLYSYRLELYCGKAQNAREVGKVPQALESIDQNTGPAAVMRSLEAVLPPPTEGVFYLVVTDRFFYIGSVGVPAFA